MKLFTIIIPVYNEERRIVDLLNSVLAIDYHKEQYEVVVVNDGSTDRTAEVVSSFQGVRLINLEQNAGRYLARRTGVEYAKNEHLLFIDARSVVDSQVLKVLNKLQFDAVIGHITHPNGATTLNVFYSYVRKKAFPEYYRHMYEDILITPDNYDTYPKGMGLFYVRRGILLNALVTQSGSIGKDSSDDTKLLWGVVTQTPILLSPEVKSLNYVRENLFDEINHLFNRGPKFVDYYLDVKKRGFWLFIAIPLLFEGSLLLSALVFREVDTFLLFVLALWIGTTLWLKPVFTDFLKVLVSLPLVVIVFYTGVIKGIVVKTFRLMAQQKNS